MNKTFNILSAFLRSSLRLPPSALFSILLLARGGVNITAVQEKVSFVRNVCPDRVWRKFTDNSLRLVAGSLAIISLNN
jgi:hypothetical protein